MLERAFCARCGILWGMSDDAVIVRGAGGKFAPGTRPSNLITSANARDMQQKRKDKAARLLRARIADETGKVSSLPIKDGAEAVAEAGGILWAETVLNPEAYARDRLEAWQSIGRAAGVLSDGKQVQQDAPAVADVTSALYALGAGAADAIIALLREQSQARIVVADVVDAEDIVVE